MTPDTLSQVRSLASRSTIVTIADFLQVGIAFFLIPIYTLFLGPGEYGALSIASTIGGVLAILYLQSIEGAYTRFHYDQPDDAQKRLFFGSVWLFHIIYAAALTVTLELVGRTGILHRLVSVPYDPHLRLVVWTAFLTTTALLLPRALFLVREQAWRYAGFNLLLFVLSTGSIVYFVAGKGEGAAGSLKGSLLATLIVAAVGIVVILRNVRLGMVTRHVRATLAFSLPLAPHLLSLWALNLVDRLILQHYVGLSEVGIYTLGYQLGSITQIAALAVSKALDPFYFKVASSRTDASSVLVPVTTYYLLLLTWIGVGTVVMAPVGIAIIGARPAYGAAEHVVPWIVLGSLARGFYFLFLSAVVYSKKIAALPLVTVAVALLNIGLNLVLIPRYGYLAAAVATLVAYAAQAILMYLYAQRVYPLAYQWRRLIVLLLCAAAWVGLVSAVPVEGRLLEFSVKAFLVVLFPFVLFMLRFFTADEDRLWRLIRAR